MNNCYTFFSLVLCSFWISSCTKQHKINHNPKTWTDSLFNMHLQDREDSSTWDQEMFQNDLNQTRPNAELPFTTGVFPTPEYNRIGKNSFKGVGNFAFPGGKDMELYVEGKTILFNSFFAGKNRFNQAYMDSTDSSEVFFHILVLTDWVDTVNYSHLMSEVVSRNHPDYLAQGYYKTQNNRIDYTAFITADRNAYAIVNMRLFDLTKGKTILVAPQKNKSLRTMQIQSPKLSQKQVETYTKDLLKQKKAIDFFTAQGNI